MAPPPATRAGSRLLPMSTDVTSEPIVPRDEAARGDADAPAWTWALPPGAWCLAAAFRASPGLPAAVRHGGRADTV